MSHYRDTFATSIGSGEIWFDNLPFVRLIISDEYGVKRFRLTPEQARDLGAKLASAAGIIEAGASLDELRTVERASARYPRPGKRGRG